MKINICKSSIFIFLLLFTVLSINGVWAVGTMIDCSADPSIVACYHFNNDSSVGENRSLIYDYSLYHLYNITFNSKIMDLYNQSDGIIRDGAFDLNSTNGIVFNTKINMSTLIGTGNPYSISLWVYSHKTLLSRIFEADSSGNDKLGLRHHTTSTSDLVVSLNNQSLSVSNSTLNNDSWYNYVLITNGSDMSFYVNGIRYFYQLNVITNASSQYLQIGGAFDQTFGFNGTIDEFILYNKSLSISEIRNNYYSNIGLECSTNNYTSGCTMSRNYTLPFSSYKLNNSLSNVLFYITSSGISIDGNLSTLSPILLNGSSIGIESNSTFDNNNVILKNFIFRDFNNTAIRLDGVTFSNIINNSFINNSNGIRMFFSDYNNISFNNFNYYKFYSISSDFAHNNIINNNIFNISVYGYYASIYALNSFFNNTIKNNSFITCEGGVYIDNQVDTITFLNKSSNNNHIIYNFFNTNFRNRAIDLRNLYNTNISYNNFSHGFNYINLRNNTKTFINYNSFYNLSYDTSIRFYYPTINNETYIIGNTMDLFDTAISIRNATNVKLYYNNFTRGFTNYDAYSVPVLIERDSKNIEYMNNTCDFVDGSCLLIRQSDNILILNNSLSLLNPFDKIFYKESFWNNYATNNPSDFGEYSCAISISEIYREFGNIDGENLNDDIFNITNLKSSNINISGNYFNSTTVSCYLKSQGTINLNSDISNSWSSLYFSLFDLHDYTYYSINNNFNNLSVYINGNLNLTSYLNYLTTLSYYDIINTRDYFYLKNTNINSRKYGFSSLNNSIIYHPSNNTLTRTSQLNQQLNYSLVPNGELYVYTDYHLTENRNLPGEPLNISYTLEDRASKIFHITNNITTPILLENISTNLSVNCSNLYKVIVTPNGLSSYNGVYNCIDNRLYLQNLNLTYSTDSNIIVAVYNTTMDFISYNNNTYETNNESFYLNLSYPSDTYTIINKYLIYNGTSYTPNQYGSGDNLSLGYTLDVPLVKDQVNHTWYWHLLLYDGVDYYDYNTTYKNITVDTINFSLCDYKEFNYTFINYSFKDETTNNVINATFDTSTFNYYLGGGTVKKQYTFTNTSENYNYPFCFIPANKTIQLDPSITYGNSPDYNTRIHDPMTFLQSNTTTQQTLFLQSVGQLVSFQVTNIGGQVLSDVEIRCSRLIGGIWNEVATGTTGSSGIVTFYLNPYIQHSCTFQKTDYNGYTFVDYPSLSTYTVLLSTSSSGGSGGSTSPINTQGVYYTITPSSLLLYNNTNYNFSFRLYPGDFDVDNFGFILTNGSSVLYSTVQSTSGGTVSKILNTGTNQSIRMDYFWNIDGNFTNGSRTYIIASYINVSGNHSLKSFGELLHHYTTQGSGIFGLTTNNINGQFALNLLVFIIIFISIGIMSYKFGVVNSGSLGLLLFGLVWLFDISLEILPNIGGTHFITIFTGIVMIGMLINEWTK